MRFKDVLQRREPSMAARKTHHYGYRQCPECDGEGSIWRAFVHYLCERCLGKGVIRL